MPLIFLLSLFLALIIPIILAWLVGGTYIFASGIFLVGIVLLFTGVFLEKRIRKQHIVKSRAASDLKIVSGQIALPKGIIPYWVTVLVFIGFGFVSSGLIIALPVMVGHYFQPVSPK